MQIVCTTPQAAAQVLTILYAAQLQPVRDFAIQPVLSTTPPRRQALRPIDTSAILHLDAVIATKQSWRFCLSKLSVLHISPKPPAARQYYRESAYATQSEQS